MGLIALEESDRKTALRKWKCPCKEPPAPGNNPWSLQPATSVGVNLGIALAKLGETEPLRRLINKARPARNRVPLPLWRCHCSDPQMTRATAPSRSTQSAPPTRDRRLCVTPSPPAGAAHTVEYRRACSNRSRSVYRSGNGRLRSPRCHPCVKSSASSPAAV